MEKQTKRKFFYSVSSFFLLAVAITAATFNPNSSQIQAQDSHYFAKTSLNELQTLNGEHKMFMDDLLNTQNSSLRSELMYANVLNENSPPSQEYKGLIAYAKSNTPNVAGDGSKATPKSDSIFLLEPSQKLSDQQLHSLAQEYQQDIPEFANVEVDQKVKLTDNNENVIPTVKKSTAEESRSTQTMEATQESTLKGGLTDNSVRVALIDSGIDPTHEVFKNKKVEKGWNEIADNDVMYDDIGHGTHIGGILESQSQNITLIPYKVVSEQDGKLSHVIKALNQAIADHANVINMSFVIGEDSYSLREMISKAIGQNIAIVAAAGNNSSSQPTYPASYDGVISVAAVDDFNEKMQDSDYGNWVSAAAYGYRVLSSIPNNQYGRKSGTSQATGFVTSVVANILLQSNKTLSAQEIKSQLKKNAITTGKGLLTNIPIVKTGTDVE